MGDGQSVEKIEEYVRRGAASWIIRADFPMIAFRRDTGEHVASCELHRFNWEPCLRDRPVVLQAVPGEGFATEAAGL